MKPPTADIATFLAAMRAGARVTITCPLCDRPGVSLAAAVDHAHDAVIVAPHRHPRLISRMESAGALLFVDLPAGWLVRCPMSWQPITAICDGEHAAPVCSDPCCYHSDPVPE